MTTPVSLNPYQISPIVEILNGLVAKGNVITNVVVTSICCNTYNYTINYTQPNGQPNIQIGMLNCLYPQAG